MPGITAEQPPLDIAIVGGGIIGLILANGLVRQNVKIKVYEQAQSFREIGAGMAFTTNAAQCMDLIDPAILTAFRTSGSVATSNGDSKDPNDYLRWTDGYNQRRDDDPEYQKTMFKIDAGYKGFQGCRRDQFLEALVQIIPPEVVECKKRLEKVEERGLGEKLVLKFQDGTTAEADAVIGCDGIKSKVREVLFGVGNPASYSHYTHKVAYRGLIPMEKAIEAIGEYKARNQHNHIGPNAHLIHYPVANQTVVNATAFITDPNEWLDEKQVAPGSRKDVEETFKDWHSTVRKLVSLLPEKLERWAVFDVWDYPAPSYNRGKICLAGDAAHASSPHHGAGACMGVEDALCLSTLISQVSSTVRQDPTTKGKAISEAFAAFDTIRRARTQWLVNSSRRVCELYQQPEWANKATLVKAETCFEEIKDRSLKIWHFDYNAMLRDTVQEYGRRRAIFEREALQSLVNESLKRFNLAQKSEHSNGALPNSLGMDFPAVYENGKANGGLHNGAPAGNHPLEEMQPNTSWPTPL